MIVHSLFAIELQTFAVTTNCLVPGARAARVQRVHQHQPISSNRCIAPVLMNNGLENGPLAVRKGAFLQQKGDVCFFLILRLRGRSKSIHPIKTLASPLSFVGYVCGFCSFIENCLSSLYLMMYISAQYNRYFQFKICWANVVKLITVISLTR